MYWVIVSSGLIKNCRALPGLEPFYLYLELLDLNRGVGICGSSLSLVLGRI